MRFVKCVGFVAGWVVALGGTAFAAPITALTPLSSNGSEVFAVYIFGKAADTSNLNEVSPNGISNIFCNHSNGSCTASVSGQTVDLGNTDPGIVFSLTDITVPYTYRTDTLASDGYAHDLVSATVAANDPAAVAGAYALFGQGALPAAAAISIATLGLVPDTVVTFVGWEDRLGGDYDYNDMIIAFTDPPPRADSVPEPATASMFGLALAGLGASRRRKKAA